VGGWSTPRPGRFTPGKDPEPIILEAGWAPGPVSTDAENLAPTGILSPNRSAVRESQYELSYPGRIASALQIVVIIIIIIISQGVGVWLVSSVHILTKTGYGKFFSA